MAGHNADKLWGKLLDIGPELHLLGPEPKSSNLSGEIVACRSLKTTGFLAQIHFTVSLCSIHSRAIVPVLECIFGKDILSTVRTPSFPNPCGKWLLWFKRKPLDLPLPSQTLNQTNTGWRVLISTSVVFQRRQRWWFLPHPHLTCLYGNGKDRWISENDSDYWILQSYRLLKGECDSALRRMKSPKDG